MDALALWHGDAAAPGVRALHNMSAPPAMRISIRPLTVYSSPARAGSRLPPGYRCLARVDLEALLAQRFPGRPRNGACQRFAALTLLARGEPAEGLERLARERRETLEDGLREAAARLDPQTLGLPAFALARGEGAGYGPPVDPVAAIALLTRTAGAVFVAGRSPRLAGLERPLPVQRYLIPTGTPAPVQAVREGRP